ncbi:MAG: polyamine aminopropyltransferase [Desulfobacterales bacterium]
MMYDSRWISEKWENVETRYRIKTVLYEEKTHFQHMVVVDSYQYGRMLLLDGIVQTTEKDEFVYHEMMVHVPMLSHSNPKRILIIGGGDGGVLREVLKHPCVENAHMVEIDPKVVDFSSKYFPNINKGAFSDHRAALIFDDGAEFVASTHEKYDIVIVDSPDPVGPAKVLFEEKFYSDVSGLMKANGIMVCQTGSLHMQPEEQRHANRVLANMFVHAKFYTYTVPTYVGGLFSSIFCSNGIDPEQIDYETLAGKAGGISLKTQYYNPGIHLGAFSLPEFFRGKLK